MGKQKIQYVINLQLMKSITSQQIKGIRQNISVQKVEKSTNSIVLFRQSNIYNTKRENISKTPQSPMLIRQTKSKQKSKSRQKYNSRPKSKTAKKQQSNIYNTNRENISKSPKFKTPQSPMLNRQTKSKQKSKSRQKYNSRSKSKTAKKQSKMSQKKVQHLIKNLLEKHNQMKRNLERLRIQKVQKQQKCVQECSFSPSITRSPRFKAKGTFLQRQRINIQQRQSQLLKKQIQKAQQQVKQCRFYPEIVSKEISQNILHKRQVKKEHQKHKQTLKQMQSSTFNRQGKLENFSQNKAQDTKKSKSKQKKLQSFNWPAIKYAVKLQLQRINLQNHFL